MKNKKYFLAIFRFITIFFSWDAWKKGPCDVGERDSEDEYFDYTRIREVENRSATRKGDACV